MHLSRTFASIIEIYFLFRNSIPIPDISTEEYLLYIIMKVCYFIFLKQKPVFRIHGMNLEFMNNKEIPKLHDSNSNAAFPLGSFFDHQYFKTKIFSLVFCYKFCRNQLRMFFSIANVVKTYNEKFSSQILLFKKTDQWEQCKWVNRYHVF